MYTISPHCRTFWKSWQEQTGCVNSKMHQHQEQAQHTQLLIQSHQCHICKQWWMLTRIQTIQNQHMLQRLTAIRPKRRGSHHVDAIANPNHVMADARRTKKVQRSSMRRTPVPIARNSTAPNPIAYPRINVLEEEVPTELKVFLTLSCNLMSLSKHTTEDPAPGCLSRRRIAKMIYFKLWVLYFHIENLCANMLPRATSRIQETESPN